MGLSAKPDTCCGCGATIELAVGPNAKTYVCELCGSVCSGGAVVAQQDVASGRAAHPPRGPLRLGQTVRIGGDEYQLVGRERVQVGDQFWDRWVLYSDLAYPLWLVEQPDRCLVLNRFTPRAEIDIWDDAPQVQLDNRGPADVVGRGTGVIAFIEGEHLATVQPNDEFDYLELARYGLTYVVEAHPDGSLCYNGKPRDATWPAALVAEGEQATAQTAATTSSRTRDMGRWKQLSMAMLGVGVFLVFFALVFNRCSSRQSHWSLDAMRGEGNSGVLITDKSGRPAALKLPWSAGAYSLKLKSSNIHRGGRAGGACWWAQIDFLKEGQHRGNVSAEDRYVVVHSVNVWFGRYWGVDREGYGWDENEYAREHYFRTSDRGPFYLRVYTGNCSDSGSRRHAPVAGVTLQIELHSNVLMVRWPLILGLLIIFAMSFILWANRYDFFHKGS